MDVVAAYRVFVSVSGLGSFTAGAAAVHVPQSVASRRVAALERHPGAHSLDRSSRRVALTAFGQDLLPSARRLVEPADEARCAGVRPIRVAVLDDCAPRSLAQLVADARQRGVHLDVLPAGPGERDEPSRTGHVRAAIVAVPRVRGSCSVPLGLAGTAPADADVPHVRDRLVRLGETVGLLPSQVATSTVLVAAVLTADDLLLCPRARAAELRLPWRRIGEADLGRGYDAAASSPDDAVRLRGPLGAAARFLGVHRRPATMSAVAAVRQARAGRRPVRRCVEPRSWWRR